MFMTRKEAIAAVKSAKRIYGAVSLTDHDIFYMQMTKKSALEVIEKMIGIDPEAFEDGIKVSAHDNGSVYFN